MPMDFNLPVEPDGGALPEQPEGSEELADGADEGGEQSAAEKTVVPPVPGKQEDGPTFYDASKVPPELQATFRDMQRGLTQKFQEIAQTKRDLAGAEVKASYWDAVMSDPEIVQVLASVQARRNGLGSQAGEEDPEGDDGSAIPDPRVRKLEAQLQELQEREAQRQVQSSVATEKARLTAEYPDWEDYRDWMAVALDENPNRTLPDAYLAAKAMVAKHLKSQAKPSALPVERPGASGKGTRSKDAPIPDSWQDAVQAELRERGITGY